MNNSKEKTNEMKSNKVRFSIVYKLNSKLVLRLLVIFLVLDIFICAAFGVGLVIQGEHCVNRAVSEFKQTGLPLAGNNIKRLDREAQGINLPGAFQGLVSDDKGARSFRLPDSYDESFIHRLEKLTYNFEFEFENSTYSISIDYGIAIKTFILTFKVLLVLQGLILLRSIFSGARLIRRTLQPIADLAEAANSLNIGGSSFTVEKMEVLADKLDAINAARLDTRISLDETQDELKGIAEAINGMLDRINEAYRSQVRFVSDASHELRTPISVIQGYVNLLDRWGKDDEKTLNESIKAIKEESANMKGLIEQLLFLARGDNNTMPLQMESFELSELASEVFHETKMIDAGHEYESRFDRVRIYADKALIKQALRILIDNAIKYTNTGGNILISVSLEDNYALLNVQDDGIGISPEEIPRVFDRFYRADQSRARATGGTGLGLSIAKWIVERHGGHMEVLSRQEIGTRISIAIPIVENAILIDH